MSLMILAAVAIGFGGDPLAGFAGVENSAKGLSVTYTVQKIGDASVSYKVDLAKPNLARIESPSQLIVADGKSITFYDKADRSYDKRPETDANLRALFSAENMCLLGSFFDANYCSRFASLATAGKKSRKGVTYDVVSAEISGRERTVNFYIDPADKMAKIAEIAPAGSTNLSDIVLVVTQTLALDGTIPAPAFAFTPPADAVNVSADAPLKHPRTEMPNLNALLVPNLRTCCPTSTSDGLLWLEMNGFKGITPEGMADEDKGAWLMGELVKYYKTDNVIGTLWKNTVPGMSAFLKDHGYPNSKFAFYSWNDFETIVPYGMGKTIPDLATLRSFNTRDSFVMVSLGWFHDPDANNIAKRGDWHWIAMVDCDPDKSTLTFNDPYQLPGEKYPKTLNVSRYADNTKLMFEDPAGYTPPDRSAAGVPLLEGYPHVPKGQFAVIEAILVVTLKK